MAQETATQQEYRIVGKPITRIEGVGKVTGKTVYADDMKLPRMLHAKILGSRRNASSMPDCAASRSV